MDAQITQFREQANKELQSVLNPRFVTTSLDRDTQYLLILLAEHPLKLSTLLAGVLQSDDFHKNAALHLKKELKVH